MFPLGILYIDEWEKLSKKASLPEKEDFYSHSNVQNITDEDYSQSRKACREFGIKQLE